MHHAEISMPHLAQDGRNIPIVMSMQHPMTPEHHIRSLGVYVFEDPVVTKAIFHFTPASGRAALSLQARLNAGTPRVFAVAECTQHGAWASSRRIQVAEGGCHTIGFRPKELEEPASTIDRPRIVVPEQVRRGDIIEVRVKAKHPSRTGLRILPDGIHFERAEPAFFLRSLEVFYGRHWLRPRRVAWMEMSSVLSDDPLLVFPGRADQVGDLRVVFTNNRGSRLEAAAQVRFSG